MYGTDLLKEQRVYLTTPLGVASARERWTSTASCDMVFLQFDMSKVTVTSFSTTILEIKTQRARTCPK
jgi:hypothetical protein